MYAGHLSKILMKAVLIEDIDSDRRYSDEREFATSSYREQRQPINSELDKALILAMSNATFLEGITCRGPPVPVHWCCAPLSPVRVIHRSRRHNESQTTVELDRITRPTVLIMNDRSLIKNGKLDQYGLMSLLTAIVV